MEDTQKKEVLIVTPKSHPYLTFNITSDDTVIFLAGPVMGCINWQDTCVKLMSQLFETSSGVKHPIHANKNVNFSGRLIIVDPSKAIEFESGDLTAYKRQVKWETKWLNTAALSGVIFFNLAKHITCTPGRSYAQTTRFELAEWITKYRYAQSMVNLVLCADPNFPGLDYIKTKIEDLNLPIYDNLYVGIIEAMIAAFKRT